MMRLLMLYGVNCTKHIWDYLNPYLRNFEIDYVEYPHEVTLNAKKVDDITEWVYKYYGHHCCDAIIGHSLGGIIALQLIAEYKMKVHKNTKRLWGICAACSKRVLSQAGFKWHIRCENHDIETTLTN